MFNFSGDAARYSVGVQFDGPLNRQAERNAYRSSLIAYQQARRSYMLQSDRVEQAIRRDLRQLELQRVTVEVARLTVISAEPKQLTVVHIDGSIDMDGLRKLSGNFGIPSSVRKRFDGKSK